MEKVINFTQTTESRRLRMIFRIQQLGFDVIGMENDFIHISGTQTLWGRLGVPSDMTLHNPDDYFPAETEEPETP